VRLDMAREQCLGREERVARKKLPTNEVQQYADKEALSTCVNLLLFYNRVARAREVRLQRLTVLYHTCEI
jgi:hypothetical protein